MANGWPTQLAAIDQSAKLGIILHLCAIVQGGDEAWNGGADTSVFGIDFGRKAIIVFVVGEDGKIGE
jgi:hypothetical protein